MMIVGMLESLNFVKLMPKSVLALGSAMHALAQPTPLGKGPKGFLTVLNKAIVVTEKVGVSGLLISRVQSNLVFQMKFVINLTQLWAFGAIKLSVLFFYRRIFKGKIFDICTYVMICIVVAWTLSFFFAFLFQCGTNFGANWSTLKALLTQCHAQHTYQLAMAVSDVLTDGLILLIPIPLVICIHATLIPSAYMSSGVEASDVH